MWMDSDEEKKIGPIHWTNVDALTYLIDELTGFVLCYLNIVVVTWVECQFYMYSVS